VASHRAAESRRAGGGSLYRQTLGGPLTASSFSSTRSPSPTRGWD
jgi:hypothetical protein